MNFWDLIRPAAKAKGAAVKAATAAELGEALAQAEAAAAGAEELAGAIAQERGDMLLTATDAAIDEVDGRLRQAQREADRNAAAVAALQERLVQAEEAERQAGLDALFAEGENYLNSGVELMREYGDLAVQLVAVVNKLQAASEAVFDVNASLRNKGDARQVANVDETARPEDGVIRLMVLPIWRTLRIPSSVSPHRFIYPKVDDIGLTLSESQVVSR